MLSSLPIPVKDPIIKQCLDESKEIDQLSNSQQLDINDKKKTRIISIAQRLETIYIDMGMPQFVSEICSVVVKIYEISGLGHFERMIYRTLPSHYKQSQSSKEIETRTLSTDIKEKLNEIEQIDVEKLDIKDIRTFNNRTLSLCDKFAQTARSKGFSIYDTEYDQFTTLRQNEQSSFKKACIGEPLATAEQLCEEQDGYKEAFERVKKSLKDAIHSAELQYKVFVLEFPPLTTQDCIDFAEQQEHWNEMQRPYVDDKYRRDHFQRTQIALTAVSDTTTKASKESRIPCAHHLDKHGNPVFRGMTKEQIDSMYVDEINFHRKSLTILFSFIQIKSRIFASHAGRAREDRALDLSPHLSHHA